MRGPIRIDRVRTTKETTFGWLDHRLLRDGWLERLGPDGRDLYLFLSLAANRDGLSWYAFPTIAKKLDRDVPEVRRASTELQAADLVAFQPFRDGEADGVHQLLSLPKRQVALPERQGAARLDEILERLRRGVGKSCGD